MTLIFTISLIYFFAIIQKTIKINKSKILFSIAIIFSFILIYFTQSYISTNGYKFMSESVISKALTFQKDYAVSSFSTLITGLDISNVTSLVFGFISFLGYVLNRSEMWGLFIARYNPTFNELLFGSGPLNFGQLYGEIPVNSPESLLLPHSSVLSYLVFVGLIPTGVLLFIFLKDLYANRANSELILFSIYIFVNIFKNDSMNYFSPFITYIILYLILRNKKDLLSSGKVFPQQQIKTN
jgi:hypothetical protein